MKRIRVLLYGPSQVLDSVRGLFSAESDFELVGETARPLELLLAVKDTGAEVVVLAESDDSADSVTSHLFAEYPGLTVLAVSGLGASLAQMCLHRQVLADQGGSVMLAALRRAVEHRCQD